jgi:hypothetical protein
MSAWTCLRQGRLKDRSTSSSNPMMEGPCADSGEKHEPASDVDAAAVDSLKALDPSRPIREADIRLVQIVRRKSVAWTPDGNYWELLHLTFYRSLSTHKALPTISN